MTATIAASRSDTVEDLPVDRLTIGEDVRLDEDADALAELAASIADLGVLQPLIVRAAGDGWEVVAGRRRLSAARIVDLDVVPCIVRVLDDDRAFDAALAENLHRRELSWIEVALAYARLRERGLEQQQIAALVGKSPAHVSQILKLLTIPKVLQDRVHRREISYVTALDRAKRGRLDGDPGGASTHGNVRSGADAELATHWRRRHDRLIAGINQVLKARDADPAELRQMLERLLKVDRQPLAEKR